MSIIIVLERDGVINPICMKQKLSAVGNENLIVTIYLI